MVNRLFHSSQNNETETKIINRSALIKPKSIKKNKFYYLAWEFSLLDARSSKKLPLYDVCQWSMPSNTNTFTHRHLTIPKLLFLKFFVCENVHHTKHFAFADEKSMENVWIIFNKIHHICHYFHLRISIYVYIYNATHRFHIFFT